MKAQTTNAITRPITAMAIGAQLAFVIFCLIPAPEWAFILLIVAQAVCLLMMLAAYLRQRSGTNGGSHDPE